MNSGSFAFNVGSTGLLLSLNPGSKSPCLQVELFLFAGRYSYSSELNLIEGEWRQIKAHQIRGQIFEDEYDLAIGVMAGVQSRGDSDRIRVKTCKITL